MADNDPSGFWSYTHRDNELDSGRILRLSEAIKNEFEIITGGELKVFVDSKSISWGEAWRIRIDTAIFGITFLIPVMTPRFFTSPECRREVLTFSGHAASLGLEDLLLPIHYVNVPQLTKDPSGDEVMALLAQRQWVDWRDLRLEAEDSPAYRKAINELALRLSQIVEQALTVDPPVLTATLDDESAGFIEIMAAAEEAMPRWVQVVEDLSRATTEISSHMTWAAEQVAKSDAAGQGFSGRLSVFRKLRERLNDPVDEFSSLGSKYSAELVEIDPAIIQLIRTVAEGGLDSDTSQSAKDFFVSIKGLCESASGAMPGIEEFRDGARTSAQLSKELRPLMNELQAALQKVVDGQTIIEEWGRRIDEVGDDSTEAA
ncbi:toll/interleukin-1 receptor domain-containing protein [Kitasatospora sp. NPDC057015]|uniref:toll/interleukin-1 receptor domain-containing protein n=1 Tax=Kitasatospora sp. NPDC057015 TaxID=3346001 RepID=UPI0036343561